MGVIKVTRGPIRSAVRWTLYGVEGIGKTTLATQCPAPLVLDTEDGTRHLDVARVAITDWQSLTLAVKELIVDSQGFQTVVIDSADWSEKLLIEWMLKDSGKRSIEDYGFGKGYTMLSEHWSRFLASCDGLIDRGINVVFVAHSTVRRVSPPDQTDGYDRYELKLTKQVAPLLREWCDLLTFATYKTKLVEGGDGRLKATGKSRVLYAERGPAWDAKNRFGLPEEMPLSWDSLRKAFPDGTPLPVASAPTPAKAAHSGEHGSGMAAQAAAPARPGWLERVNNAQTVEELGRIADEADEALSTGELTPEKRQRLDKQIDIRHQQLSGGVFA